MTDRKITIVLKGGGSVVMWCSDENAKVIGRELMSAIKGGIPEGIGLGDEKNFQFGVLISEIAGFYQSSAKDEFQEKVLKLMGDGEGWKYDE